MLLDVLPVPFDPAPPALAVVLATWFGTGLVEPLRAGLAVFLALACAQPLLHRRRWPVALCTLALIAIGLWAAQAWVLTGWGDDRRIVIDEVAGALLGRLLLGCAPLILAGVYGAIFLALDRFKPAPMAALESLPGSLGIMADDLGIGLALAVVIALLRRFWRHRAAMR